MLETIREYGLEQLAAAGELAATRKAHAAYCLVLAEEGATNDAVAQVKWLDMCDAEYANFRAALDYLIDAGDAPWALRLGAALLPFWQSRAYLAEGRDRLTRALRLAGGTVNLDVRARATFALGTLCWASGDIPAATTIHGETLQAFRALGDRRGIAVALNALGICRHLTEPEAATIAFEEALSIWREIGDDSAAARTLSNMAAIALHQQRFDRAGELYRGVQATCDRIGDAAGAAWAIDFQGQVEYGRGNLDSAQPLYVEALRRFREIHDGWGVGDALLAMGQIALDAGDHRDAHRLFAEAHGVLNSVADIRGTARVIEAFARLAAEQRDASRALKLAGAAAALRKVLSAPLQRDAREVLDRALNKVRQGRGAHESSAAWMEGWVLSAEDAVQYALSQPGGAPIDS